jgi:hypothetical protein
MEQREIRKKAIKLQALRAALQELFDGTTFEDMEKVEKEMRKFINAEFRRFHKKL